MPNLKSNSPVAEAQFLTVYEGTVEATNELTNYRFKGTTASDIRIVITSGNASISEVKIKELKN